MKSPIAAYYFRTFVFQMISESDHYRKVISDDSPWTVKQFAQGICACLSMQDEVRDDGWNPALHYRLDEISGNDRSWKTDDDIVFMFSVLCEYFADDLCGMGDVD